MTTWKQEDEYMDYTDVPDEEPNAFAQVAEQTDLPAPVLERISAYADRSGKGTGEVRKEYLAYIENEYSCTDWQAEDEDLLVDWAEQMFVQTRRVGSGSNANSGTWVGVFIGKDKNLADRMTGLIKWNLEQFDKDPEQAVSSGRMGIYERKDGEWHLTSASTTKSLGAGDTPPYGIKHGDQWLALTSRSGDPTPNVKMGRYAYFLGGEQEDFVKNATVRQWRVDLTEENADMHLDIGRPCTITVKPPKEGGNPAFADVLQTYGDFMPNYDYDKFPLSPMQYLTNTQLHDMFVPIENLEQAYESGKQTGSTGITYGPLLITKGTVSRMSSSPRDSDYDPAGYNYNLTVSSTIHGDIDCWIPGHVGDQTSPFTAGWGDDRFDYAERSTVLVFGRVGLKERDGLVTPKMNVMGVYADPRRARRRATGGDTGLGQFN